MNTKRATFAVIFGLIAVFANVFSVFARAEEQPFVTPLRRNQLSLCQAVSANLAQLDTPMRKADYDLLDRAAQCVQPSAAKVRLMVLPVTTLRDNRFAAFKEMQADQTLAPASKSHPVLAVTPFADFKTQQADQLGE